jgi:hypothetical protein
MDQANHMAEQVAAGLRAAYGEVAIESARYYRSRATINPAFWDLVIAVLRPEGEHAQTCGICGYEKAPIKGACPDCVAELDD